MLHRHEDGFIALASADEDTFRPRTAIRANQFANMFPEFREQLAKDAYVGIHAAFRTRSGSEVDSGYPAHREETLRYLTAAYCDIDYYRRGFNWPKIAYAIALMEHEGAFPKYSLLVNSGRSAWLFWFLHAEGDPSRPQQAFWDQIVRLKSINAALAARFDWAGADRRHSCNRNR